MWQRFETELLTHGVATEAQLALAREHQARRGGLLLTHLIAVGCSATGVLAAASRATGIPIVTKGMLRRARTNGRPDGLDWISANRALYAPLGDGRVIFADPAVALQPEPLRLPPHRPLLAEERKVRALLDAFAGKLHGTGLSDEGPSDEGAAVGGEGPLVRPARPQGRTPTARVAHSAPPASPRETPAEDSMSRALRAAAATLKRSAPVEVYVADPSRPDGPPVAHSAEAVTAPVARAEAIEVDDVAPLPSRATPLTTSLPPEPFYPPEPLPVRATAEPVRTRRRDHAAGRGVRTAPSKPWSAAAQPPPPRAKRISTLSLVLWSTVLIAALVGGAWALRNSLVDLDAHALEEAETAMAAGNEELALERARVALERSVSIDDQQRALWVRIKVNLKAQRFRAVRADVHRYIEQALPEDPNLVEARATANLVDGL